MSIAMNIVARRRSRLALQAAPQAALPATSSRMQISEVHAFPVREPVSKRAYTVVRVRTSSGLTGYGECARASSGDLTRAREFLIGRPASAYTAARQLGPVSGAIDVALLDILAQSCQAPVYRLLGGPTRNKVRAMTTLRGANDLELTAAMKRGLDAGYRAFAVPVPEAAARNQGQAYAKAALERVETLRAAAGNANVDFVLNGADHLTPGDAATLAAELEKFHLLWFDEPCRVSNLSTIRKIAGETVTPLGFGRQITEPGTFQDLLREGLIDIVRPDLLRNGISQIKRLAAMAEPYYTAVAPHHEGGPIATAAAIHLAASLPNFFIQHIPLPEAPEDARMRAELMSAAIETVRDGFAALPTAPGLGITVSEKTLEQYKDGEA
ncbi:MAG: mandelate racemase/muconate lactonizing enzyme family protein [Acidobacteriota bacterium]|nr:mandelate racemase/muconate lactonizing enzyme family protein [Acidobacteriota bacterium]